MKSIYLDNASTSFPKAPGVGKAVGEFLEGHAYNIGRGVYESAQDTGMQVMNVRQQVADFFDFPSFRHVIFTQNITMSLNVALKGLLKPGDEVLCTSMEHNASMRPLRQLERQGVIVTVIPCNGQGLLDANRMENAVSDKTRAVVMSCASNICGTVQPLKEVGELCERHDLFYILDTAQAAGHFPLSAKELKTDALCFTGHKGIMGPQGIGGMLLTEEMAFTLEPLISGGTGSFSNSEEVPESMPDRFEPGTQNLPGIIGLGAALDWTCSRDMRKDFEHELMLTKHFIEGLDTALKGVNWRLLGLGADACSLEHGVQRVGVTSLDFPDLDNAEISWELASRFGVMTRCGLHCAPRAHQTLGTFPQGTIRFSFGKLTDLETVDEGLSAIEQLFS